MNSNFKAISAIFLKDFYSLLPLVLLTVGMLITETVITDLKALESASSLIRTVIPYFSFLTCAILLVSVVQMDPAASLTHDWLTRPIPKLDHACAKILFLLLVIVVPLILSRCVVNIANGLPLVKSISGAMIVESSWFLLAYASLICVAMLSRSSLQTAGILMALIVALAIIATVVPLLRNTGGVGSERTFISTFWISAFLTSLMTVFILFIVYWLQYYKRQFMHAYLCFASAFTAISFVIFAPFAAPTWSAIFSLHQLTTSNNAEDVSANLKLDFAEYCFPASYIGNRSSENNETTTGTVSNRLIGLAWSDTELNRAGLDAIAYSTTIFGRGIPLEYRYITLKADVTYFADSLQEPVKLIASGSPAANPLDRYNNSAKNYWLVPEGLVKTLSSDPTTQLSIDYYISVLAPSTYELEMDGVHRHFPLLGSCNAVRDQRSNRVEVKCFKRGSQPAIVSAELSGIAASRIDADTPSYTPAWLESWNGKYYEMTVASPSLVNSSKVILRAYESVSFIHRQKTLSGFLGSSIEECPLPEQTDFAQFSWSDPSPHRSSFVAVDQDVRLEVLDWGGPDRIDADKAKTLVLLAGAGATAHSYDDIAPLLSKQYRVIGITRRGFGVSSKPNFGYDVDRLAKDVVIILDNLKITSPILVGHSFGGEELSAIAANYPNRMAGLVYLDAAYDRTVDTTEETAVIRYFPPPPRPSRTDLASYDSILKYMDSHNLDHLPAGELMASYDMAASTRSLDPRIGSALMSGVIRPEYEKINVPALAIYAVPTSSNALIKPWYDLQEPEIVENAERLYQIRKKFQSTQIDTFRNSVNSSQVLLLEDADHWVFISNRDDVFQAINSFVSTLN